MDFVNLLISLVSGIIGGNIAGASMPDKSLGALGNSVVGFFGGGIGGFILQALGVLSTTAATTDMSSLLANIGSSGVGGAVLMFIVSLIKNSMAKRA